MSMLRRALSVVAVVGALGGAACFAPADIVLWSGAADKLDAASGRTGALANFFDDAGNVRIHAWNEKQRVVLDRDLAVDITRPGTYQQTFVSENTVVAAGTLVNSHLIFFDPAEPTTCRGSFTFDGRILGVIVLSDLPGDDRLLLSDFLADPRTICPQGHFEHRGIEFGPERIVLSADGRTLELELTACNPGDQIRVLTAVAIPSPSAAGPGLGLLGILAVAAVTRRLQHS